MLRRRRILALCVPVDSGTCICLISSRGAASRHLLRSASGGDHPINFLWTEIAGADTSSTPPGLESWIVVISSTAYASIGYAYTTYRPPHLSPCRSFGAARSGQRHTAARRLCPARCLLASGHRRRREGQSFGGKHRSASICPYGARPPW